MDWFNVEYLGHFESIQPAFEQRQRYLNALAAAIHRSHETVKDLKASN